MRLSSTIRLLVLSLLLRLEPTAEAQVTIANEKIALNGDADPYGGVFPTSLKVFRLGDDGALLFHQEGQTSSRLYSGSYAGLVKRLADGARATGNRPVSDFTFSAANDAGQLAVMAYDGGQRNIYLLTGAVLKTVAVGGSAAPGDGDFTFLYEPAMDAGAHIVFKADTTQSGQGLFYVDASAATPVVKKIAVVDNTAPDGGTYTYFDDKVRITTRPDGKVVMFFNAATTDEAGNDKSGLYGAVVGGDSPAAVAYIAPYLHPEFQMNHLGELVFRDFAAIYRGDLSGFTTIAQQGDPAPSGDEFTYFGEAAINDAGTVVFQAITQGGNLSGLYLSTAGGLQTLVLQGQQMWGETLLDFGVPQINKSGLIAFTAEALRDNATADSLYLSDGTSKVRITGTNEVLGGSTIGAPSLGESLVLPPDSLNLHGQVAFSAKLTSGKEGLFIATPTSHLRAAGPGLWDDPLTWDFRIVPGPDTPVVADSTADASLEGPAAPVVRKIRSVTVGGGTGSATLHLQPSSLLTVPKGVSILDHGILSGSGTITGNLTMTAGAGLNFTLGGNVRPAFDFLRVTGTATIAGALTVTKSSAFEPTRGQTFDLLDLTRRIGTFGTITLPVLNPAGQTWDATKLYTTGAITVSGATLFAPVAGVFTGNFEGDPSAAATSGSLLLTLSPAGRLTGSFTYAGRRYVFPTTTLNVDGSATVSFGVPKKTLQVQVATVNQLPQLTARISTGAVAESQASTTRANPAFPTNSPLVGHYTIALPADPAHPEATFPQGTGYAKVTVTTRGQATVVGVLGDGTAFSAGGPLTTAGELPFYVAAYALKGVVEGKLVLHGSTPADSVEGSFRWLKPTATTGKFKSAFDATVTVYGSGYRNPVAPAKMLTFANDQATFHAVGGNVDPLPDKVVKLSTAYAFKSTTVEPFALTFSAATYGLGSGSFRDAQNKVRTMKGVALQKQNAVVGLLIGTDQTGTFDID